MKSFLLTVSAMTVISLAYWAYQENYNTRKSQQDNRDLQREIAQAKARLRVLNAEWAYLNRPDRLRRLSVQHDAPLGLLPLDGENFGQVDQVAYPVAPQLEISLNTRNGGGGGRP